MNEDAGVFFPQNQEYVKTSDLVKAIAEVRGKKSFQTKLFNLVIKRLLNINIVDKVFGNLAYDEMLSEYPKGNYQIYDLWNSIKNTEQP